MSNKSEPTKMFRFGHGQVELSSPISPAPTHFNRVDGILILNNEDIVVICLFDKPDEDGSAIVMSGVNFIEFFQKRINDVLLSLKPGEVTHQ